MLKEKMVELKELVNGYDRDIVVNLLQEICNEYDKEYMIDDIVHTDVVDDMVKHEIENSDWTRVACFLAKVNYLNDEYYLINGYGNLEEITMDYLGCIVNDLENEIQEELEEEEED